jgi:hypothetical protein
MTSMGRSPSKSAFARLDPGLAKPFFLHATRIALFVALSIALFWFVSLYSSGLRDARYFDGWLLAIGMGTQLCFHVAVKTAWLQPNAIARWKSFHIFLGYALAVIFLSHSNFSLPDTVFEWALWLAFSLITLSGIFGSYVAWALRTKGAIDERIRYEEIPARRSAISREAYAVVTDRSDPIDAALPIPPYHAWIMELYAGHLRNYFEAGQSYATQLFGLKRQLHMLTNEIDTLSRYVDFDYRERLAVLKSLVTERDRLDFARVHLALSRAWLFVHVPLTYSLVVLTVLHILVVYAFSSGSW